MEIAIIKKETVGNAPNVYNESETIAKYEIMDGAPVRGVFYLIIFLQVDHSLKNKSSQSLACGKSSLEYVY